jgi:hypothetical protein
MSDSLFGGASTTVAEVGKQLAELARKFDDLTDKVQTSRNPNLTADAIVMKDCPAPLVGCNPALLYKKTGGELTCPPLDQAPDPLIVRPNGQICYARSSLEKEFKGKNLNIRDLTDTYAKKLIKLLENSNYLATAVQAATEGPKGSPIIINYYSNNPFVVQYTRGVSMFTGVAAPAAGNGLPAGARGFLRNQLIFVPPSDAAANPIITKDDLAAMLTKFSQNLDINSGAALVTELMNSISPNATHGVFDVDVPPHAAQEDGVGAVSTDGITFPTHSYILQTLFTAVVATHRDSSRRARIVEGLNGLAIALEFGELAKNFDSTMNRRRQAVTAANSAIAFLPKSFRDWVSAGLVDGTNNADPRFTLAMFVNVSLLLIVLEAFDTSAGTKYVNCIKALRVAYNNMRSTEGVVQELLKKKADGSSVFEEEIQIALRNKRGAAQGYVQQTVKLGTVLAELLSEGLSGAVPVLLVPAKHITEATTILTNASVGMAAQDPQLSSALSLLSLAVDRTLTDFRGTGPKFSGNAARAFFAKIMAYSRLTATQALPDEEVFVTKEMFRNAANARTFAENVKEQERFKFSSSLPVGQENFCKVKTSGTTVYLWARNVPQGYQSLRARTFKQDAGESLIQGARDGFALAVATFIGANGNALTADDVGYIVSKSCAPLESGEDALARKFHVLGSGPIDQMIKRYLSTQVGGPAEIATMESDRGMNKNQRDAYTTLQIVLHYASGTLDSANLAATVLMNDVVVSNALVARVFALSAARAGDVRANVSATTTFASHGPLKGGEEGAIEGGDAQFEGGEDFEGGEEFEGGDDWESFADRLLNGGALTGGKAPAHSSPEVIKKAMDNTSGHKFGKNKKEIQELHTKLAAQGYEVTYFYDDKCPAYLHSNNNTFGTPGEKRWVETKNPWAKCQEQMGFQFVSKNGFCYPHGMTCFPEDDLTTATHKTAQVVDNWTQLAQIYNSVQQKRYNEFMAAETARIRGEPQNADLTDAEVEELAKSHVPSELAGVPEHGAVQTLVTLSTQLEDAVSEISSTSDANQREEIKRILRNTGSMRDDWADDDKVMESANLQRISTNLLADAKACTDASIAVSNNVASDQVLQKLSTLARPGGGLLGTAGLGLPNIIKTSTLVDSNNKCDVLKTGEGPSEAVLIPKTINQRIDLDKLAKGEPVDPIVNWWRTYYGAKAYEEAKNINKIASKLSPFEGNIPKPAAEHKSAEEALEESLRLALGKRGSSMVRHG